VGVGQPRHERAAAAVDDLSSIRRGNVVRRDRLDSAALDKKTKAALQRFGLAVEQLEIREDEGAAGVGRLRRRAGRKAKRGERGAHAGNESSPGEFAVDPPCDRTDFWRMARTAHVCAGACRFVRSVAGEHKVTPLKVRALADRGNLTRLLERSNPSRPRRRRLGFL